MNDSEIGLQINLEKTKIIDFAQTNPVNICTTLNSEIILVYNFKYFGSWKSSSLKDFEFRKALAWKVCHNMKKLWKSNLAKTLKIRIVKVTIKTTLLYGTETWTINKWLEKRINGCYTKLLRMVLNVFWKDK